MSVIAADYESKRDFATTPEPRGDGADSGEQPRFVIQEHSATRLHWDLRLEHEGTLASWALPNGLPWAPKDNRLAVHTEDHPLEYLEFSGEIPAGNYGAGTMTIWDRGTFEVLKWDGRKVEVALHGERAQGRYALFALDKGDEPKDWMVHRMDPPADPGREPIPDELVPMLARVRRVAKERPVTYIAFDLLWLDGHKLDTQPYEARRDLLRALLADGERWQVPDHVVGNGTALLEASRKRGLEGVVAKRLGSLYEPGRRSASWVKVKNRQTQELVIGGWLPGDGHRTKRIGALLVGRPQEGGLRFCGRVGSGFTEAELERLQGLVEARAQDASPFDGTAKQIPTTARFVAADLVCEVEFVEWTKDGIMRAPVYRGPARPRETSPEVTAEAEIVRESNGAVFLDVDGFEIRLSNPDKVLFPAVGLTKRDYVDYLVAMAPTLLAHLRDRQLTLKRYPNGVDGQYFYEKNAPSHRPDWVAVEAENFVVADSAATLAWLGNLADLELHTPMHRNADVQTPAMVAFDLDPGEPAGLLECCRVAILLEGMFGGLGLECFPKTSGSKGMQVYVPLNVPGITYAATKAFAKAVAELLESELPDLVVSRQAKARRAGKVLVDWSQNDRHKTTVCVYSVRARQRPTVSTPLRWDEVRAAADAGDADGLAFDVDDVRARIAEHGDLFAPTLRLQQELPGT